MLHSFVVWGLGTVLIFHGFDINRVFWHMAWILSLRELMQEDSELEGNVSYIVIFRLEKKNQNTSLYVVLIMEGIESSLNMI